MGFGYSVRKKQFCFDPKRHSKESPFSISRSKIDLFIECPRCFYLDQRMGIKRPDSFPLSLNNAVDELLKREFDILRKAREPHPLMRTYNIKAVPYDHPHLDTWRDALKQGVQYHEPDSHLIIRGGIDDVWINDEHALHVVDYKATSKREPVTLDASWQDGYKRQVEVYQWLLRKNGFTVSNTAYFVYANGNADADAFDGKLEFDITIIPYEGNDSWITPTIQKLHTTLMSEEVPPAHPTCTFCEYRTIAGRALQEKMKRGNPLKP